MSMVEVSVGASVGAMEEVKPALMELALWKPCMDLAIDVLQANLGDLHAHMDHLVGTAATSYNGNDTIGCRTGRPPRGCSRGREPRLAR
jgi:hypothetical protein